ncbi:MAG: hypothetical protein Fur0010_23720 [Bdellovibrio sp.]
MKWFMLLTIFFLLLGCQQQDLIPELKKNDVARETYLKLTKNETELPDMREVAQVISNPGAQVERTCLSCIEEKSNEPQASPPSSVGSEVNLDGLPDLRTCVAPCDNNRRNFFDESRSLSAQEFERRGGCTLNKSCPTGMVFVCSSKYRTRACIARDLEASNSVPIGNLDMNACRNLCARYPGGRLPTNNEWLVGAAGTNPQSCLPRLPVRQGCRDNQSCINRPNPNSSRDMADTRYNEHLRNQRPECVSRAGLRDMVGVLGQWVTGGHARSGLEQFNGGLWSQPYSTVYYRTTAHTAGYSDYSIGCRCAADPH